MPVWLIVVGSILLFFLLLLLLRVRLTVTLRDDVTLTLRVLFVTVRLYPRRKKVKWRNYSPERAARIAAKKAKKQAKKAAKKAKSGDKKHALGEKSPEQKATLAAKIYLIRALVAALLRRTGRHLSLRTARLDIRVATGDAASTAVLYGAVSGAVAALLALLDRAFRLRVNRTRTRVVADYLSEKTTADVRLVFGLRVYGALAIGLSVAIAYLRTKQQQKAKQKSENKKINDTRLPTKERSYQNG